MSRADLTALEILESAAIEFAGEEEFCGFDFSQPEGEAMVQGYGVYASCFPLKKHYKARNPEFRPALNTPQEEIHHAAREGDRWHWLVAMIGPDEVRRIACLEPNERLRRIAAAKNAARAIWGLPPLPAPPPNPPRLQVPVPWAPGWTASPIQAWLARGDGLELSVQCALFEQPDSRPGFVVFGVTEAAFSLIGEAGVPLEATTPREAVAEVDRRWPPSSLEN